MITVGGVPLRVYLARQKAQMESVELTSFLRTKQTNFHKCKASGRPCLDGWAVNGEYPPSLLRIISEESYMWDTVEQVTDYPSTVAVVLDIARRASGPVLFDDIAKHVKVKKHGVLRTYIGRTYQLAAQKVERALPRYLSVSKQGKQLVLIPKSPIKARSLSQLVADYDDAVIDAALPGAIPNSPPATVPAPAPVPVADSQEAVQRVKLVLDLEINVVVNVHSR